MSFQHPFLPFVAVCRTASVFAKTLTMCAIFTALVARSKSPKPLNRSSFPLTVAKKHGNCQRYLRYWSPVLQPNRHYIFHLPLAAVGVPVMGRF